MTDCNREESVTINKPVRSKCQSKRSNAAVSHYSQFPTSCGDAVDTVWHVFFCFFFLHSSCFPRWNSWSTPTSKGCCCSKVLNVFCHTTGRHKNLINHIHRPVSGMLTGSINRTLKELMPVTLRCMRQEQRLGYLCPSEVHGRKCYIWMKSGAPIGIWHLQRYGGADRGTVFVGNIANVYTHKLPACRNPQPFIRPNNGKPSRWMRYSCNALDKHGPRCANVCHPFHRHAKRSYPSICQENRNAWLLLGGGT